MANKASALPSLAQQDFRYGGVVSPLSIATLTFISIYSLIAIIMTIIRRNHQPIKSRNFFLIITNVLGLYIMVLNANLRLSIGIAIYPCYLYLLGFTFTVPFTMLSKLLQIWRLYFVYKVNVLKTLFSAVKKSITEKNNNGVAGDKSLNVAAEKITLNKLSKEDEEKKKLRTFKIWSFWISSKFFAIVLIVGMILHAPWYALLAWRGVDHTNELTCHPTDPTSAIVLAVEFVIYFIAIGSLTLLAFIHKVYDRWLIRTEVVLLLSFWFFVLGIFSFNSITKGVYWGIDYWLPHGFVIFYAAMIDIFVSCYLPIIFSFFKSNNISMYQSTRPNSAAESQAAGASFKTKELQRLKGLLADDKMRESFKQFCVASFCPESILFWEDISLNFKKLTTDEARKDEAKKIIAKYIEKGSPLELNLTRKGLLLEPVLHAIREYDKLVMDSSSITKTAWKAGTHVRAKTVTEYRGSSRTQSMQLNDIPMGSYVSSSPGNSHSPSDGDSAASLLQRTSVSLSSSENSFSKMGLRMIKTPEATPSPLSALSQISEAEEDPYNNATEVASPPAHRPMISVLPPEELMKDAEQEMEHVPPTVFDSLLRHVELDLVDPFYRYSITREYKKLVQMKEQQQALQIKVLQ